MWHRVNSGWSFLHQLLDSQRLPNIRRLSCPRLPLEKPLLCQSTPCLKVRKRGLASAELLHGESTTPCPDVTEQDSGCLAACTYVKPVTLEERHVRLSRAPPSPLLSLARDADSFKLVLQVPVGMCFCQELAESCSEVDVRLNLRKCCRRVC